MSSNRTAAEHKFSFALYTILALLVFTLAGILIINFNTLTGNNSRGLSQPITLSQTSQLTSGNLTNDQNLTGQYGELAKEYQVAHLRELIAKANEAEAVSRRNIAKAIIETEQYKKEYGIDPDKFNAEQTKALISELNQPISNASNILSTSTSKTGTVATTGSSKTTTSAKKSATSTTKQSSKVRITSIKTTPTKATATNKKTTASKTSTISRITSSQSKLKTTSTKTKAATKTAAVKTSNQLISLTAGLGKPEEFGFETNLEVSTVGATRSATGKPSNTSNVVELTTGKTSTISGAKHSASSPKIKTTPSQEVVAAPTKKSTVSIATNQTTTKPANTTTSSNSKIKAHKVSNKAKAALTGKAKSAATSSTTSKPKVISKTTLTKPETKQLHIAATKPTTETLAADLNVPLGDSPFEGEFALDDDIEIVGLND